MNGDQYRIDFLLTRDTPEQVLEFARRCVKVYRGATLASKRKYSRGGAYRRAFIESYLFHKRYVEKNNAL